MSSNFGYGTNEIIEHYRAVFSRRESHLPGAGWTRQLRSEAMDAFQVARFPSPDWERWRHIPMDALIDSPYRFPEGGSPAEPDADVLAGLYLPDADAHRLVFLNGYPVPHLSQIGRLPKGVVVGNLAGSLASSPEAAATVAMSHHLNRYIRVPYSGFALLNTALFADGAFIYLPPGVVLEKPVHLVFVSTARDDAVMVLPRVLIVAEQNSAVDVVESFASLEEGDGGAPCLTNAVTEIAIGRGAIVNHCKLQTESARNARHVAILATHQDRDSRFVSHSVSAGARIARNDIESTIDGQGSECVMNGLYLADGRQYVDYYTFADHVSPHGKSAQHYKGILAGKSHGVFNGKVHIYPDCQHIDARQRNENLLLSRDAQVSTRPQLDILADDVQCSHGATVGQLDENMVFYLRSRGIPPDEAENLLTYGFAGEIVDRVPVAAVRTKLVDDVLTSVLNRKFAGLKQTLA